MSSVSQITKQTFVLALLNIFTLLFYIGLIAKYKRIKGRGPSIPDNQRYLFHNLAEWDALRSRYQQNVYKGYLDLIEDFGVKSTF